MEVDGNGFIKKGYAIFRRVVPPDVSVLDSTAMNILSCTIERHSYQAL